MAEYQQIKKMKSFFFQRDSINNERHLFFDYLRDKVHCNIEKTGFFLGRVVWSGSFFFSSSFFKFAICVVEL
jgi:hypothetical protein